MNIPTVSILIPVYNAEKHLQECLDYALGQTLRDIEVVCVNDCSTDNSLAILNEYAAKDARLKVIDLPENGGTFMARKRALSAAVGQYVTFCDPDDYLSLDACQCLYTKITEEACDALMFGTQCFGASPEENQHLSNWWKILAETMESSRYLIYNYCESTSLRGMLWGWLMKTSIIKQAYDLFPDIYSNFNEDSIVLFATVTLCQKICGLDQKLYNYRKVSGITMAGNDLECISQVLKYHATGDAALQTVLPKLKELRPALAAEIDQASICFRCRNYRYQYREWVCRKGVSVDKSAVLLRNYYPLLNKELFVKSIAPYFQKMKIDLKHLKILEKSGIITPTTFHFANIKTVAFINLFNALGGIERYITKLIPVYQKMGLRVILINETEASDNEYPLLADVKTYVVSDKPELRVDQLAEIFQKEQVDLVYVQSYDNLFPDLLVAKLLYGIPVINHWHNVFSYHIHSRQDFEWKFCLMRKFSDLTISLSPSCECFFRANGIKAKYLINLPSFSTKEDNIPVHPHNRPLKTILWLARLAAKTKQPRAAVQIMQEVVKKVPDAKMLIVGGVTPWFPDEPEILTDMIKKAGLENNVTLCGEQLDVESYYRQADVFLVTSNVEGFAYTIYEASAHGLPVVMYDLPYLAYHSYPGNGIVSVPMNDKNAAAEAICRILQNEDEHRELSARSRKMAEDISAIDFEQEWREIFAVLERGGEEFLHIGEEHQGALRVMMETLREHTLLGVNTKFKNLNDEIAHLKKNQASWLVRKFRGGIQCLKDNGFRYTVKRFFEKVKGKLSRRKGAA